MGRRNRRNKQKQSTQSIPQGLPAGYSTVSPTTPERAAATLVMVSPPSHDSVPFPTVLADAEIRDTLADIRDTLVEIRSVTNTIQKDIQVLKASNALTFEVISGIYKSHLVKAASKQIYWSKLVKGYANPHRMYVMDTIVDHLKSSEGMDHGLAAKKAKELTRDGVSRTEADQATYDTAQLKMGARGGSTASLQVKDHKDVVGQLEEMSFRRLKNEA